MYPGPTTALGNSIKCMVKGRHFTPPSSRECHHLRMDGEGKHCVLDLDLTMSHFKLILSDHCSTSWVPTGFAPARPPGLAKPVEEEEHYIK